MKKKLLFSDTSSVRLLHLDMALAADLYVLRNRINEVTGALKLEQPNPTNGNEENFSDHVGIETQKMKYQLFSTKEKEN